MDEVLRLAPRTRTGSALPLTPAGVELAVQQEIDRGPLAFWGSSGGAAPPSRVGRPRPALIESAGWRTPTGRRLRDRGPAPRSRVGNHCYTGVYTLLRPPTFPV